MAHIDDSGRVYVTAETYARKHGVSQPTVWRKCQKGLIAGAIYRAHARRDRWLIPVDAPPPPREMFGPKNRAHKIPTLGEIDRFRIQRKRKERRSCTTKKSRSLSSQNRRSR